MTMCAACERGDHANCGLQTWCECDCDPEAADWFFDPDELPAEARGNYEEAPFTAPIGADPFDQAVRAVFADEDAAAETELKRALFRMVLDIESGKGQNFRTRRSRK